MISPSHITSGNATHTTNNMPKLTIDLDLIKKQISSDTRSTVSMQSPSSSLSYHSSDDSHTQPQHLSPLIMDDDCIHTHYKILPTIVGEGQFGTVRKCIQRATGKVFAVKSILKTGQSCAEFDREMELLHHVDNHRGVVTVIDAFEDAENFYLVTELCRGGELYDRIIDQMSRRTTADSTLFSEQHAARILHSILDTVAYLHDKDIVHRDLKPENFLFNHQNEIKLIDFGLATTHDEHYDAPMTAVVGTPFYMAPEVLKRNYTKACDMWSVGVMAYILLVGRPPFEGEDNDETFAQIRRGSYSLEDSTMSAEAKDFIKCLLKRDPRRRWSAEEAIQHPWMVKNL